MKTFITVLGSVAALYFVRSDESKQAVMSALVSGYEMNNAMKKENPKDLSMANLMDDIKYFTEAAEALGKSIVMCQNQLGHFDTMNTLELSLAGGTLTTQHNQVKAHVVALLAELKSRLS